MDNVYVLRERLQAIYGRHSKIFDKGLQFLLALVAFLLINQNVGFMKAASSPVITVALAVICTFLPLMATVVMATALLLAAYVFTVVRSVCSNSGCIFGDVLLFLSIGSKDGVFSIADADCLRAEDPVSSSDCLRAGICAVKLGGNFLRNDRILYDGICKKDVYCIGRQRGKRTDDTDYQICKAGVPK